MSICDPTDYSPGFPGGSVVKNPPAIQEPQETCVRSLGWEDPLKEGGATHSSVLVWWTPWTGKPSGLQSMGVSKTRTWLKHVRDTQTPLFIGFCRQEYWSGLLFPSPGDLPNPGIKPTPPVSPALQPDSLPLSHKCILFILNFWADIWFVVDTLESNYWLPHLKFNDSREIKWKRVRQIDNRIDQCQACFFSLLSSLLIRTLLCNSTITQKGKRNYLPLQIQRQEIRG